MYTNGRYRIACINHPEIALDMPLSLWHNVTMAFRARIDTSISLKTRATTKGTPHMLTYEQREALAGIAYNTVNTIELLAPHITTEEGKEVLLNYIMGYSSKCLNPVMERLTEELQDSASLSPEVIYEMRELRELLEDCHQALIAIVDANC